MWRGIICAHCGLSVEHNGPQFIVIEDAEGYTLAYVCDEECEKGWTQ